MLRSFPTQLLLQKERDTNFCSSVLPSFPTKFQAMVLQPHYIQKIRTACRDQSGAKAP